MSGWVDWNTVVSRLLLLFFIIIIIIATINNVCIYIGQQCSDGIVILRDGNRTIYPLAKDSCDSIREPQWLDLGPIRCLGLGTHTLTSVHLNHLKNTVAIIIFDVEHQLLMNRVLRGHLESIKLLLTQLQAELSSYFIIRWKFSIFCP